MKRLLFSLAMLTAGMLCAVAADFGCAVTWDRHGLLMDGHRVMPVMGEVHYSRIPADEWPREIRKMREGGVTIVATYVFWNHIEEEEGIFRWDGQRDLRRFLEVCRTEQMPVVLRLGPFCHGEVRNGGIPDWMFHKGCRLRSQERVFLGYVEKLYRQIFTQVQGLQWKDGGPVLAAQFDNEYRGSGDYLMALKRMALAIGFDLPPWCPRYISMPLAAFFSIRHRRIRQSTINSPSLFGSKSMPDFGSRPSVFLRTQSSINTFMAEQTLIP